MPRPVFHRRERCLLFVAAGLLVISIFLPYWYVLFNAPQYPKGLRLWIYINRVAGDVREIDNLNHYIGMKRLADAAPLERKIAVPGALLTAVLTLGAAFVPRVRSLIMRLPAIFFPIFFLVDLSGWLRYYGTHLDPKAPIRLAPFIPPLLGVGRVGQFSVHAYFHVGLYLAFLAAVLTAFSIFFGLRERAGVTRRVRRTAAATLILLALVQASPSLNAKTRVVAPSGPYRSLAAALQAAQDGDVIRVLGGVHRGHWTLDRSLQLIGEERPVLDGTGSGTVLHITAPDVRVRGFIIRNSGTLLAQEDAGILVTAPRATIEGNRLENVLFGVILRGADGSIIRNNRMIGKPLPLPRRGDLIRVWHSTDVRIAGNRIRAGRDVVLWFSDRILVRRNRVEDCRYGIHFMYTDDARLEENRLERNSVGAYLMYSKRLHLLRNQMVHNRGPSGYGVGLKDMDAAQIEKNVIADNRVGLFMDNSSGVAHENVFAYNDAGIAILPSVQVFELRDNSFQDNAIQVTLDAGGQLRGTVLWRGNFWSDYRGFDADRDGIGDLPYHSVRVFERLTVRHPVLRLFHGSPSVEALEFASRLFPIFAPQPLLEDPTPRMHPLYPNMEARGIPSSTAHPVSSWALVSLALFLFAIPVAGSFWPLRWLARPRPCARRPIVSVVGAEKAVPDRVDVVRVRDLTVHYGARIALSDLSFEVQPGETLAFWGPNGAGKTTIMRCLLGVIPFQGEVRLDGRDVRRNGKTARRRIGYLPQEIRLYEEMAVREILAFFARLKDVDLDHAVEMAKAWELDDFLDQAVGTLSGGMRQRLGLVLALLADPPILLLDEPTSNLDVRMRAEFAHLLERLRAEGRTLIVSSHRLDEIVRLADRVIVLEAGRMIATGRPEEVRTFMTRYHVLILYLADEDVERARHILAHHGFDLPDHPRGLAVRVANGSRAVPLQLLAEQGIRIEDFELLAEGEGGAP